MKKYLYGIILIFLSFELTFANETIRISAPAPTIYAQISNDQLVGPSIEMMKLIFSEFGLNIETVPLPWARAMKYLKSGKIDAVAPIFYNEQRASFIQFTDVFDTIETRVFTQKNKFGGFNVLNDLKGFKGLTIRGRSEGLEFDKFATEYLDLSEISSLDQMLKMILIGRADYGIDKRYDIAATAKKMGVYEQILITPLVISTNNNLIGFSKKSAFLRYIPRINMIIRNLKKDGTIEHLIENYINNIDTK